MEKKPSPIRERSLLLMTISKKNYAPASQMIIAKHVKKSENPEQEAKKLRELINLRSEQEVIWMLTEKMQGK